MSTTYEDRRSHPRLERDERVIIRVLNSTDSSLVGEALKCSSLDLSPEGIRVSLDKQVEQGCELELWINISGHPRKCYLCGEVKWVQETDNAGIYATGIAVRGGTDTDDENWRELFEPGGPLTRSIDASQAI